MSITIDETPESRQMSGSSITYRYLIQGTADAIAAKAILEATAPLSYNGWPRGDCTLDPEFIDDATDNGLWRCTVPYARASRTVRETGESTYSFDTGGGTQHITQSLATVDSGAASGTATDHKGAIGVTGEGTVEGVNITVPAYMFSETYYIDDDDVDGDYKAALFYLTGKVNDASFRGFAAGEVLFLGASGSQRGDDDWEITFRFAASPNQTGLTAGSITGLDKKGWEYLWVRYGDVEDATSHRLAKRPIEAYVEQVYYTGDFSALGI